ISAYGGTISPAPNFAYDLCAREGKPEEMEGVSLHTWELALNGSEPVRADTLERFHQRFGPHGFRKEALRPRHGLAEATRAGSRPPPGGARRSSAGGWSPPPPTTRAAARWSPAAPPPRTSGWWWWTRSPASPWSPAGWGRSGSTARAWRAATGAGRRSRWR